MDGRIRLTRCSRVVVPRNMLLRGEETTDVDARLTKDGTEGSLRHVSGMARQGNLAAGPLVTPDFVASGPGPVER